VQIVAEEAARQAEREMAAYEAKWRTFQQRQADVLARNKATLFEALAAADSSSGHLSPETSPANA
jgi:hypothetical protein